MSSESSKLTAVEAQIANDFVNGIKDAYHKFADIASMVHVLCEDHGWDLETYTELDCVLVKLAQDYFAIEKELKRKAEK